MQYRDLGKYIRETIKQVNAEENISTYDLPSNFSYSNNLIFADIDELSIVTNGDISNDNNYFDPLKYLTEGMM